MIPDRDPTADQLATAGLLAGAVLLAAGVALASYWLIGAGCIAATVLIVAAALHRPRP